MKKVNQEILGFLLGALLGAGILAILLSYVTRGKILPRVVVAGVEVGGMTKAEAREKVTKRWEEIVIIAKYGESAFVLPKESVELEIEQAVAEATQVGRRGRLQELEQLVTRNVEIEIPIRVREERYEEWLSEIRMMVEIKGVEAEIEVNNQEVKIINGDDGVIIKQERLRNEIIKNLSRLDESEIEIATEEERGRLQEQERERLLQVANKILEKKIEMVVGDEKAIIEGEEIVSLLDVNPENLAKIDKNKLVNYVEGLQERYSRVAQDAKFKFVEGKVEEFVPAKDGIEIVKQGAIEAIEEGVGELEQEGVEQVKIEIPIERTPPKITTEEVNELGIVELIGKGESYYAHSIPNRVYNVALAAGRVDGALVAPGEEFSFNETVGEISQATGYKTAYVISNGRTELGDGGGVCQVSTTVFRAAMDAGLPITERWAHAYRVGYYEQNSEAGFDATIYSPSKDLKFVNDTPGYILIQTIIEEPKRYLKFEIYGTKDSRVRTISEARVWGVTPPPPDLYQDDPSLPVGVVKQVDWAAWGAKAAFDYQVEKEGEITFSKTFTSSYKPWANVYLRGVEE